MTRRLGLTALALIVVLAPAAAQEPSGGRPATAELGAGARQLPLKDATPEQALQTTSGLLCRTATAGTRPRCSRSGGHKLQRAAQAKQRPAKRASGHDFGRERANPRRAKSAEADSRAESPAPGSAAQSICETVRQLVQIADRKFTDLRGRPTPVAGIYEAALALPGAACFVASKPPVYKCRWRDRGSDWQSKAIRFGAEVQQCFSHPTDRPHSKGVGQSDATLWFTLNFTDGPDVKVTATPITVLRQDDGATVDFVVTPNHWAQVIGEKRGPKDTVTITVDLIRGDIAGGMMPADTRVDVVLIRKGNAGETVQTIVEHAKVVSSFPVPRNNPDDAWQTTVKLEAAAEQVRRIRDAGALGQLTFIFPLKNGRKAVRIPAAFDRGLWRFVGPLVHRPVNLFLSCPEKSASCREMLIEDARLLGVMRLPIIKDGQIVARPSIASLEVPAEHAEKVLLAHRQDRLSFAFPVRGSRNGKGDRRVVTLDVGIVRGDDPTRDALPKQHLAVIRLGQPGSYSDVVVSRAKVLSVHRLPLVPGQDRWKATVTLDIPADRVERFLSASKHGQVRLIRPLKENRRAVTIGIDIPGSGLEGFILPGDRLLLSWSRILKKSLPRSVKRPHRRVEQIARDTTVLAVENLSVSRPNRRRVLVALDLSAEEAEKTTAASAHGGLRIGLRRSGMIP